MKSIIELRESENIVLYFKPINSVSTLKIDDELDDTFKVTYQYSYSIDDVNWSTWVDTIDKLITDIKFITQVYIRINLVVLQDSGLVDPKSYTPRYFFKNLIYNGINCAISNGVERLNNDNVANENGNLFNVFDSGNSLYKPKNLMAGLDSIRVGLARVITNMADITCKYYRTTPDTESSQVTLRTFESHTTSDVKEIRITFSGGRIPDARPVYSEYEQGYELGFEIEITKYEFQQVFGAGLTPSSLDYLLLNYDGRVYEVNTVYENRDLYNEAILWKAYLVKYEDRASVSDDDVDDKITDYTKYVEGYGVQKQINEIKDATGNFDTVEDMLSSDDDLREFDPSYMQLDISNITNLEKGTYGLAVDYPTGSYMYQPIVENFITYDISSLENDNYNIMFWFEYASTGTSSSVNNVKLATFGNYNLYLKESGLLKIEIIQDNFAQTLSTKNIGGVIEAGIYCISINHIEDNIQKFLTLSVYNTDGDKLQENMIPEKYKFDMPTSLTLHGNSEATNLFGDIRVKHNYVNKNDTDEYILLTDLVSEDYVIKDHVKVGLDGDKVRKGV